MRWVGSKRKLALALWDFAAINASFALATWSRGLKGFHYVEHDTAPWLALEAWIFALFSLFCVAVFAHHKLYHLNVFLGKSRQVVLLAKAMGYCFLFYCAASFLFARGWNAFESRLTVLYLFLFAFCLIALGRLWGLRPLSAALLANEGFRKRVAIVGGGEAACWVATRILTEQAYGLNLVGFVSEKHETGETVFQSAKCLGKPVDLERLCLEQRLAMLIVAPDDHVPTPEVLDALANCKSLAGVQTFAISRAFESVSSRFAVEELRDAPLIPAATNRSFYLRLKRLVDIAGASVGILVLSPLMIGIALAVKLTSPGPIVFRQTRVGKGGRRFEFLKFRSMRTNNDAAAHQAFVSDFIKGQTAGKAKKIENDPRVTSIGRWLRKTSLDELPQLFNVLKGDMSLVGPRPCLPYEYELYESWHKQRLSVTPGCTGFWQVHGRSRVDFHDMVVMDLFYIDNMSPWMDLLLLLKTLPAMLGGRGAC